MENNPSQFEQIFVYGTLLERYIQKEAFGSNQPGIPDVLLDYEKNKLWFTASYTQW